MRTAIDHISVLVPARDEEILLTRCLDSLIVACSELPPSVSSDIVVAVDSSTDGTWQIAEAMIGDYGHAFCTDAGVVGLARSQAARIALSRYSGSLDRCWLANTDADSRVPKSWLIDQLAIARSGIEAVAGIVEVDSFSEHRPGIAALFRQTYIVMPDGTHPHVHGANLGVRADAYLKAGGWGHVPTAEDHDLWRRLGRSGCNMVSVASLKVITSGRRNGRAPNGFAGALAAHNEALV